MLRFDSKAILESPFRVESIEETPAPAGVTGVWHRYVITQGANTIVGMRSGTLAEVGSALEQTILRLNERLGKQQMKLRR